MADYRDPRDQRNWGRNDPRSFEERGYEGRGEPQRYGGHGGHQRHDYDPEQDRTSGGFGRGSSRDRMGSEQFRSQDEFGGYGEHEYRDFGRGQPGGVYEHSGERDYRHGSGYGGFGQSPGESGGGFGSGRTYAAEPGWGPDYGQQGGRSGSGRAFEGQGGHPGGYGTQHGGYGEQGRYGQGRYGQDFGQQRSGYPGGSASGQSFAPSGQSYGHPGQFGQSGFGEAGHSYGQQGFGQQQYGHGSEAWHGSRASGQQRRHGRGPKGYQRSDERLKEDISERLMSAMHIDASEVSVDVRDGKVTLEGTVPERRMKHWIEDMADDCMGVKDIDNRIRVGHSAGESGSEGSMSIGGGQGAGASGSSQGLSGSSVSSSTRNK